MCLNKRPNINRIFFHNKIYMTPTVSKHCSHCKELKTVICCIDDWNLKPFHPWLFFFNTAIVAELKRLFRKIRRIYQSSHLDPIVNTPLPHLVLLINHLYHDIRCHRVSLLQGTLCVEQMWYLQSRRKRFAERTRYYCPHRIVTRPGKSTRAPGYHFLKCLSTLP